MRKVTGEEFAVKVIDKTSLSSHEKFLLRGEIGAYRGVPVGDVWVYPRVYFSFVVRTDEVLMMVLGCVYIID